MQQLLQSSVFIHILAACIWIGGSIFLGMVFVPMLRHKELGPHASKVFGPAARRFRTAGWICLGILVISGFVNLHLRGFNFHSGEFWSSSFGRQIALKLFLLLIMVGLGLFHDLVAGPKAVAARHSDPDGAAYRTWRRMASWVGRINVLLSLLILWIAVDLFH